MVGASTFLASKGRVKLRLGLSLSLGLEPGTERDSLTCAIFKRATLSKAGKVSLGLWQPVLGLKGSIRVRLGLGLRGLGAKQRRDRLGDHDQCHFQESILLEDKK